MSELLIGLATGAGALLGGFALLLGSATLAAMLSGVAGSLSAVALGGAVLAVPVAGVALAASKTGH